MGHAEQHLLWISLAAIGMTTAATCWGVVSLRAEVSLLRKQILGNRDYLG